MQTISLSTQDFQRLSELLAQVGDGQTLKTDAPVTFVEVRALESSTPIDALSLSTRVGNILKKRGILTVETLCATPSSLIAGIKDLGSQSLLEINERLFIMTNAGLQDSYCALPLDALFDFWEKGVLKLLHRERSIKLSDRIASGLKDNNLYLLGLIDYEGNNSATLTEVGSKVAAKIAELSD